MFNVRVVTVDYYISKPIHELYKTWEKDNANEWQEPILRIFGTTADGFKACVHVHGVYPYIYIPYKGGENPDRDSLLLGAALDEALKTTLNPNIFRFVHKVTLVSGIPLYGYHSKCRQFFKIYFYNPCCIRKASELLLSGAILGQKFQPHEAHIPFTLQFMMDYHIYGMSFATFSKIKYRRNLENPESLVGVKEEDFLSNKVKKITCCHLEVDAFASDIVNRIDQRIKGTNPGLRALWEDERSRRREQDKDSQITDERSGTRISNVLYPTEIMYKAQLAQKLKQISFQETKLTIVSDKPAHSYPAEVYNSGDFLDASAIEEDVDHFLVKEHVSDVSSLIDERILSQIVESQKEKVENGSEEEEEEVTEADSVLGRNQIAEEEAELEDEEGMDMTQPLNLDEEFICGVKGDRDVSGNISKYKEDTFWKNMADKIFQLDGAQESSSESETEMPSSEAFGGPIELSSAWPGNIMSILSEDSGCPTPSTLCQTPSTFWSNYSPNWLPQNQDAWAWNKSCAPFSDFASKTPTEVFNFNDFSQGLSKSASEEPYDGLFTSNDGELFQPPAVTPFCSVESAVFPSSAILTPAREVEGSNINLNSDCENLQLPTMKEGKFLPSENKYAEKKTVSNRKAEGDRQKFLHVLNSFAGKKVPSGENCAQLTLKQYIKDCKEIVSIDFKNLCNKEMIIIEYKSESERSFQNKYLIKPLDKFLESWDLAERKASDSGLQKNADGPKIISGFNVKDGKNLHSVINVLERRFSDSSTVQSVRNELRVKSMEILPDEEVGEEKYFNVKRNMISRGEIKMKLDKSENLEKKSVEKLNEKSPGVKKMNTEITERVERGEKNEGRDYCFRNSQKVKRRNKLGSFFEPDKKLIKEINSSFEEYFKTIVQRKHFNRKKNSIIDLKQVELKEQDWEGEEEEEQEEEKERNETSNDSKHCSFSTGKKRCPQDVRVSSDVDSIKFVTKFLSTFSKMSDLPPLTITISLGNSQTSVPVHVNLQQAIPPQVNKVKCYNKAQSRRMKVENFDGAADGSSSEDSANGEYEKRACSERNVKRENYYKPLNVIVCGSPSKKKETRKKRKISSIPCPLREDEEEEKKKTNTIKERKSFPGNPSEDGFGACRKKRKIWSPQGESNKKITSQNLVNSKKNQGNSGNPSFTVKVQSLKKVLSFQNLELDFIEDSDEERKRKLPVSWSKVNPESELRIQGDMEAFTSSDDNEMTRRGLAEDEEGVAIRSIAQGKKRLSDGIPCFSEYLLQFRAVNEKNKEKVEGSLLERSLGEKSSGQSFPRCVNCSDPNGFSWNLKTSGSKTGLSQIDNEAKSLLPQRTLSPLILPESPLLSSNLFSFEFKSTDTAFIHSERESFSPGFCSSLNVSERKKDHFQNKFFESSETKDLEAEFKGTSLDCVIGQKIIKPKKRALLWKEIVQYVKQDFKFESEENAPFYSDIRDLGKAMEAGPKVLKVPNLSVAGLKLFKSSLYIHGAEERRNILSSNKKTERFWLVRNDEDEDASITPLLKPPPPYILLKWSCTCDPPAADQRGQPMGKKSILKRLSLSEEMRCNEESEFSVTIHGFSREPETNDLTAQNDFLKNCSRRTKMSDFFRSESVLKKESFPSICDFHVLKKFSSTSNVAPSPGENVTDIAPRHGSLSSNPVSLGEGKRNFDNSFQIRGITLSNTFGFLHSVDNLEEIKLSHTHQYMSMLVMELHVQTRNNLRPDPYYDPIRALFYTIAFDSPTRNQETGILVVGDGFLSRATAFGHSIHYVPTEKELIKKLLDLMNEWDPEILAGYEIEMQSWGYLVQRGFVLEMNLVTLLGRVRVEDVTNKNYSDFIISPSDEGDCLPRSLRQLRILGRILLDVWRILRHEVALTSYTFENVMYHLSHERHPLLSYESLSRYWEDPNRGFRHLVVEFYMTRVLGIIRIMDQLDFINRTSELSRLFGIQFYEVLSRGSQFRVESMMLRLAKPLNYVPASPSVAQRAAMRAPTSLPLILEPESLFYSDPIIVLDFQSLYPSIIIAYNYCFSTCLGRIEKLGGREPFEFGCTHLQIAPEELRQLENDVSVSPAGVVFVKSSVRKGILPIMLQEILDTRLMVKKSMKENKGNKRLGKVLYARQLGLKLIANVTYGYTAANFSGRMPCVEVGDSVVSKGRETLHRAIELVKNTREWGAKVVYGDTDSIFVCTPGKTRNEAFKIGAEIAEAVTRDNPKPVKLKLEKVYHPSILQTKKRYVGFMFESPDTEKPIFEAKGIETVRRDGCPATGKILEKALQILFDTKDVSLVKKYTIRQFAKVFQGHVNMQDFIFAKEYRGRNGYRAGACVPALQLAKQWTAHDKRAEPRVKERVPYVIVNGPPGMPLIRLVRSPTDLISDPSLRINAVYYITKAIIPPMQRCFSLLGVDVMSWFFEMPRKYHRMHKWYCVEGQKKSTISQYFSAKECMVCSDITNDSVCPKCEKRPQLLIVHLNGEIQRREKSHGGLLEICRSCCSTPMELECVSLDCPVLYRKKQAERALNQGSILREILNRYTV